jgi:hypothetical protein
MKPASIEFTDSERNQALMAVWAPKSEIQINIELLRDAFGRVPEALRILSKVQAMPFQLASELVELETDEEAFEFWLITRFNMALEGIKAGVDIEQLCEETNLSMSALRILKDMETVPESGEKFERLKSYAYRENCYERKY